MSIEMPLQGNKIIRRKYLETKGTLEEMWYF